MKTIIAAFALLSLAAGPVFAAGAYVPQSAPQTGYYGISPSNPALTGGGSLGHNGSSKHSKANRAW